MRASILALREAGARYFERHAALSVKRSERGFEVLTPLGTLALVAFGTFRDRPVVYVRVVDSEGVEGWGEAWCNWPAVGAEHRARLPTGPAWIACSI